MQGGENRKHPLSGTNGEISEDKKMRIKEETKVEGLYKGWEEGKG
jgi:hypothetical protein